MTRMFVIVLLVLSASSSMAEPKSQRAEELYEEGVRFYNLAQYDNAVDAFQQSYMLSGQTGLLFNIAQAYRQATRCPEALTFYRNYLRAEPDAANRAVVERHIAEMEACSVPSPAPVAVPAVAPPPPVSAIETRPSVSPWTWTLGATGVALAAGGTALLVSTSSGLDTCSPRCSPDRIHDLRLRAGFGYGLLGGAGVSLAAATWLWLRVPDRDNGQSQLGFSLGPSSIAVWSAF